MDRQRILFVCAGNICRSPLAEGIFRHLATEAGRSLEFEIDSAGIGGWHQGERPDRRSVAVAAGHGIDISSQRARRIASSDFGRFDLILAMDQDNLKNLRKVAPADLHGSCTSSTPLRLAATRTFPTRIMAAAMISRLFTPCSWPAAARCCPRPGRRCGVREAEISLR